jgi:hypothetical protein
LSRSTFWGRLVEAAGIEPDPGQSTNRLMAHDFRSNGLL